MNSSLECFCFHRNNPFNGLIYCLGLKFTCVHFLPMTCLITRKSSLQIFYYLSFTTSQFCHIAGKVENLLKAVIHQNCNIIIVYVYSKVKFSGFVCWFQRYVHCTHFLRPAGGHKSKLTHLRALRKQRLEYLLINVHLYIVSGVFKQGVAIDI